MGNISGRQDSCDGKKKKKPIQQRKTTIYPGTKIK